MNSSAVCSDIPDSPKTTVLRRPVLRKCTHPAVNGYQPSKWLKTTLPKWKNLEMNIAALKVIYEDNHLLVVNKPAGIATMGVAADSPSIVTLARAYLKDKYHKPGNVYVGVVSRLDSLVSGVLILARTSKAAARLSAQFRDHETRKLYWAVVDHALSPESGTLEDWLRKDEPRQRMVVADVDQPGAQPARLRYRLLSRLPRAALLEIELLTGRKHQIRVQLSHQGSPILGDRKYASNRPFAAGIALHAHSLTVRHPTLNTPLTFSAPLPAAWNDLKIPGSVEQ